MKRLFLLALLAVQMDVAHAQTYRCDFEPPPARVVEEEPFQVSLSYEIPAGSARLHAEMKTLQHIVISGEIVEVRGKGKHTFSLRAPARAAEKEILIAGWLGEDWQQPLAPVVHTPVLRVLARSQARRLEEMKSQAEPTLKRLGYGRSEKGNVALLDDDLPGLDRSVARVLSKALAKRGLGVTTLDAQAVSNPYLLTTARFDVLILGDSRIFPASALDSLQTFLESGGDLVALNGPAFSQVVWQANGKWFDREGVLTALAEAPGRRVFMDFEKGDASSWRRESNNREAQAGLSLELPGQSEDSHCAHLNIDNLTGWDTFASPELESPFPQGHQLTCFYARGDKKTSELSVEWREKDGSRWIAVVPLTTKWKAYSLPPSAFRYWHDSGSKGRGGPGDCFKPENAVQFVVGLAFTHTLLVGPGKHEIWIDQVATAPMPTEWSGLDAALNADLSLPVIEGISPTYKVYEVTGLQKIAPNPGQVLWQPRNLPQPATTLAPHPRPSGTGFGKNRRWRWVPLLEATNGDGKIGGAAAALILNGKAPCEGGIYLSIPITDAGFFQRPQVAESVASVVERMLDGVFLYEGGSRYFAYVDGEEVELGAEVANFGKRGATVQIGLSVAETKTRKSVFEKTFSVSVEPGKRQTLQTTWSPGQFSSQDYTVKVSLQRDGKVIDAMQHPLSVWRPSKSPCFMTTRDADFYLPASPDPQSEIRNPKSTKWYPHGVNYMPSSGVGVDDGEYFEYWFDPQPYDPEIIERDLEDVKAIGMNMVSVFIYYRSLDSHNLFDLLLRCQRKGIWVNLSLRPGTPMDFRWDEMRALIEKHHLAENDTIFAYDLAWEPSFGGYDARRQWDANWEKWVLAKFGSIEAAEKEWEFAIPRADGKVTGPSNEQVSRDGAWAKMVVAYRCFVDDLLHEKYSEARRLVRSVDPNHLVSFRMSVAGDPTCGQDWMPYDFKGLAGAVDLMCPEGYGRLGDWERVKDGWFTAAYSRCVAPETPVMWAEFGYSVWDNNRMKDDEGSLRFQGSFYKDFYEMVLRSRANGTVCWWFPGGYRTGERSDYGILNPDRTWRPVTHVIHDYAARLTAQRDTPKPDVLIPIDRDKHADGIKGIYAEMKDTFWKVIGEGKTPGLRWMER